MRTPNAHLGNRSSIVAEKLNGGEIVYFNNFNPIGAEPLEPSRHVIAPASTVSVGSKLGPTRTGNLMGRGKSRLRQADITRAIKAARAAGVAGSTTWTKASD